MSDCIHLDLDGAWGDVADMPTREVRDWGRRLRYIARAKEAEKFFEEVVRGLPPFVLYGSGDFHHLAGLLVRRMTEEVTVVSFDNHPDWDIRPPRWACGGWVSRAVELPNVRQVSVWGCGNFELAFPSRLFGNRSERLKVHAWAERQSASTRRRFDCMTRENWRERFASFASSLEGTAVYVTVDMDCLRREEAVTNWENGLFTAEDVAWGIGLLRSRARVIAGDVCGAWSEPVYARGFQRLAGWWDHPVDAAKIVPNARARNLASLRSIWAALANAT